jgi:histidine triad (HIT) family protein
MASIFSKIIAGDIPSFKVAESEDFYAFLDIRPMTKGHTLVVPKKEIDYFFDLEDDHLSSLMLFAKKVAGAIEASVECKRIGIAVLGLEVPHAHVHLVPINKEGDLSFANPAVEMSAEEMEKLAATIFHSFQKNEEGS